jgi:anti-sigma B factor antagonist
MDFSTENIDTDIAVVRGDGRLNMVSAPALREQVTTAMSVSTSGARPSWTRRGSGPSSAV